MRMKLKTRKRVLSVIAAVAFTLSMATSTSLDTYYTTPEDPVATSVKVKR